MPVPGLAFAENLGQWDDPARFVSKRRGAVLRAETGALWIELRSPARDAETSERLLLRMSYSGAPDRTTVEGERLSAWKQHFFHGRDQDRWRRNVPIFEGVRWIDAWPGVDVVVDEGASDQIFAYRLEVDPGADSSALAVRVDGVDAMHVDADGRLVMSTPLGPITQTAPLSWEHDGNGDARELPCRFRLVGSRSYSFEVDGRDATRPLVIDPGLVWATYLGGGSDDVASRAVVRADGTIVTAGSTWALDFPTTLGAFQTTNHGSFDAFVSALKPDGGALEFSTYVGGSDSDGGGGVALDAAGSIVFAGSTKSSDYPVTPGAYDSSISGGLDAHVTKLSGDGSLLLFATYIGGNNDDSALTDVAVGPGGDAFLSGHTKSNDFPVTPGALFRSFQGPIPFGWDGFVARLSADGSSLAWSTFLPGNDYDQPQHLTLATDGSVIVSGWTQSSNFPTTAGAFDETFSGPPRQAVGFIMKWTPTGSQLVFSTYFEPGFAEDLDVAEDGRIAFVGNAGAALPVTPGAFAPVADPTGDSHVSILAPDGGSITYATYLGGYFDANGRAVIDLAESGVITVQMSGYGGLPTTPGAHNPTGSTDFYVTRLRPKGDALLYASYIDGTGTSYFFDGRVDGDDRAIFVGAHQSGFPVSPGAFDTTYGGAGPVSFYGDGVIAKMELQPLGVNSFGKSTPSCLGPIRLTALESPAAGAATFAIACSGAPPNTLGLFAFSGAAFPSGLPIAGVTVYLDLLLPPVLIGKVAGPLGYAELSLPIPAGTTGQKVALQSFWLGTATCGGLGSIAASDALRLSIQ